MGGLFRATGTQIYSEGTNQTRMKVREAINLIEEDGWFLVRTRGSHRQYKHANKLGLVTIAGKPGDELAPGTKKSILKQAKLT